MPIQPVGWMTIVLFLHWTSHFVQSLHQRGGISLIYQYLLIVDGYNSHMTMEVVYKAVKAGLDIINLTSHTSYHIQPLDVSIFGLFKRVFKRYMNAWTLQECGRGASKMVLVR